MRKTIYVPNEEVWDEVKRNAESKGLSVSQYLLVGNGGTFIAGGMDLCAPDQLDRIESKLDLLIPKGMPESAMRGRLEQEGDATDDKSETQIIADGQAKLDAARKERGSIKKEKIAKVRSQVDFKPNPKGGK